MLRKQRDDLEVKMRSMLEEFEKERRNSAEKIRELERVVEIARSEASESVCWETAGGNVGIFGAWRLSECAGDSIRLRRSQTEETNRHRLEVEKKEEAIRGLRSKLEAEWAALDG